MVLGCPTIVKKLILIATSGTFEEKDAQNIKEIRLNRLKEEEEDCAEALFLINALEDSAMTNKDDGLMQLQIVEKMRPHSLD